ncbi:NAD(P)/FAD-dependent oxidoreductase [Streptomyces sp. NPDC048057]|uniref:NAD(P)/FAD-dependent oxidoreductase n=1 Tax=Streptomyces sp. NPDC048057 TaxID=3155628 RepID=UPI0033FFA143
MTYPAVEYDVIVIGGGPGGSMTSTLLAQSGKRVILFESAKFPRYHIGESLLSGTADLLKKIGVLEKLEDAGFIKKHGVEWVWGEHREPWTVYFKDALAMPYDYGYQVERGPFDQMLLENAREHGVDAREEHRVTDFAFEDDGTVRVQYTDDEGNPGTVTARWLVDSSGQGGTVTKRLHQQEWDPYLKNMAVWSYWRGAKRGPGLDAGNTFLPTFDEGWWWFIPLRDDITSIGVVVDREAFLKQKENGLQHYYQSCLERTPELMDRLADAEQVDEMHAQRDWSYIYDRFSGDGYIAVGDAACFIDPLFSTGVHLSMLSGYLAATTVNTILDKPEIPREQVLEFYEGAYRKEFDRLRAQVYFLYGGHGGSKESYFWHARNQFDVPGIAPEKAFISLIAGAFQHRSWYRRYLAQLDVPVELRSTIEGIFEGKSAGVNVDWQAPVVLSDQVEEGEELAVDGDHLRPAQVLRLPGGATMPLTEALTALTGLADGNRTAADLIDLLVEAGVTQRDGARSLVHEAISFGLLAPPETAEA